MADEKILRICLEEPLRRSAEAGEHNFINLVAQVAGKARFRVEFCDIPDQAQPPHVYSLTHMAAPPNDLGLVFRRVYQYPFWQIEATAERWDWDVARASFDPDIVAPDAARFYRFWQKRLFGQAAQDSNRSGYVYVPLQGRLDSKRSFQTCSPLEMVEHCLHHDSQRSVVATLHPKEDYSAAELKKLDALARKHPRLTVETGQMEKHLRDCDYVVTQNSSAAYFGYFFRKPALLFAKIDFHHIAVQAQMDRLDACFQRVVTHEPTYDKYVWWFWQDQSINAGLPDAADRIEARFRRFGWPLQ